MKKTSIYLAPELDERVAARAADEGVSKAEFIRRTLEGVVTQPKRPKLSFGMIKGGPSDMSENIDKYLEGFGES